MREIERGEKMETKKKYCLIVKTFEYSGISLWVDEDFDEDYDSEILKGVLKNFPKGERRIIIKGEEIEIINEGDSIKVEPGYYLNKSGNLEKVLT